MRRSVIDTARFRLKLCGAAALVLLCSACGDGIPKDQDDDDDTPPPPPVAALSILAGDATAEGATDGSGTAARFKMPRGIGIDSSGNLYIADQGNYVIRKITPQGVVTTLAGTAGDRGVTNGSGGNARFSTPAALAVSGNGTVYVADELNIRAITPAGQVSTLATIPIGTNVDSRSVNSIHIGGIAIDGNGNLFMTNNHGTRRLATNGATTVLEGQGTVNGLWGTLSMVPRGVTVDSTGNVFMFDLEREISRWNPNGGIGSGSLFTIAGAPNVRGSADGTGNAARFEQVVALTADQQGNLYAADSGNSLVRKITPAGVVTTVAGTRGSSTLQTGGLPGSLAGVRGIVADGKGYLYATSGNAVVKIRLPETR